MPLVRPYIPMAAVPNPSGSVAACSYDKLSGICVRCQSGSEPLPVSAHLRGKVNDSNAILLECRQVIVIVRSMEKSDGTR